MNPRLFEQFIAALMNAYGYHGINPIHRVLGRGCTHQIDAIGINQVTPTFSYPITLVAEAKYTTGQNAIGIGVIRNFYGVLEDLKQMMPNHYLQPIIDMQGYQNGTSNIIGMVISNVGFSQHFSQPYAFAHGIKLITVHFNKEKKYYFGNLSGFTVILEVEFDIEEIGENEEEIENEIRSLRLQHILDEKNNAIKLIKYPVMGEIKLLEILKYKEPKMPTGINEIDYSTEVFCYQYEVTFDSSFPKMNVISQIEIKDNTRLTLEFPKLKTIISTLLRINK
jgi:hypothetical protein